MKWSHEEDYIVCSFYLSHPNNWKQHIDELMALLKQAGYGNRKRSSVIMRVHNYEYLHTGKGLSNYAQQSRSVYKSFISRTTKPVVYESLRAYIRENYLEVKLGLETDVASPESEFKFIYTEPLGPTFQEVLFDFIDKRGMKDSEVYNACLVGRDTFSHIRKGDKGVSKRTVKQLCFGLKLTYDEAVVLMASAGYAFSSSNLSDVIVAYYLKNSMYDIDDANITLYENQAELLFTA